MIDYNTKRMKRLFWMLTCILFFYSCTTDTKNIASQSTVLKNHTALWDSVSVENKQEAYQEYLKRYPEGIYSYDAKILAKNVQRIAKASLFNKLFKEQPLTTYLVNETNRLNFKWYVAPKNLYQIFPKTISTSNGSYQIKEQNTQVLVTSLSWADDLLLFRLADGKWNNDQLAIYYLLDKSRYAKGEKNALVRLDGTAPPIHEKNGQTTLSLTDKNARDYLKFFCFFVRGQEGPFYILETTSDPVILQNTQLYNKVNRHVKPVLYKGKAKGKLKYNAVIFYSNTLFKAQFSVATDGTVSMLDDTPLITNLPVRMNVPIN